MTPMKTVLLTSALLFMSPVLHAATAPSSDVTATCKDGSTYSGQSKRGACSRHGGIKEWYGATAATTTAPSSTAQQPPAGAPTGPSAQQAPAPSKHSRTAAAAGGGAGQVWVNTDSKVYHCPGTRWYGTTKQGEYMSESQAKSQGIRADHNKPCSQ